MPVRRRHQELTHAVWLVCWWLSYQRTPMDEFFMECIDVIYMQVSEVAMFTRRRRRDGIWTVANHYAYAPARKKLPPCPFGPLNSETKCVSEVGSIPLEVRHGKDERKRT